MKKTLSLLLLFVLASPPLVSEATPQMEIRSLQGIKAFDVVVEYIDKDLVRAGFDHEKYKTAIELRFRSLGIEVDQDVAPFLYLNINASKIDRLPLYMVSVILQFEQPVFLIDGVEEIFGENARSNISESVFATTWERGFITDVGANQVGTIKDLIMDRIDEFANDYFTANPPEPRSGQEGD